MATAKSKKNIVQTILKLLSYIVIAFICIITLFLLYYIVSSQIHAKDENYRPGVSIYTIVSPSMNPVIKVYDIVVNAKVKEPTNIQIGDIITYKSKAPNSEGMTITHRVVAIDKTQDGKYEYMTQGDNNSEPDSLMVTFDQVIGKKIMIIPKLGKLQFLIANQKGWLLLLLIPIGIYLIKELAKLINLFGLRKKVTKVVEQKPEEIIAPKRQEIEERKEQIRETLKTNAVIKDSVVKNDKEPTSFLEQYSETKLEVTTNKYANLKKKKEEKEKTVQKPEEEITKVDIPTKVETKVVKEVPKVEKEIELPKVKEKVNDEYEILDTDELSTKIKEYDTKLIKLNKMIADIENIKDKKEEPKEEPFIEVDNFLKGGKIKVKSIEETKNQKKKVNTKRITDPTKYTEEVKIELTPLFGSSSYNSRSKIARPDSVDITELRIKETQTKKETTKKKKNLNLNPREVNKVKSNKTSTTKKSTSSKKRLALNPRTTQKATRNRKAPQPTKTVTTQYVPINQPIVQQEPKPVKQPEKKVRKKREPFIIIEKIK